MLRSFACGFALLAVPVLGCSSSSTPQVQGGAGNGASGAAGVAGSAAAPSAGSTGASGAPGAAGSAAGSAAGGVSAAGAAGSVAGTGGANGGVAGSGGVATAGAPDRTDDPSNAVIVSDNFDSTAANAAPDPTKWHAPPTGSTNGPTVVSAKSHSPPNSASSTGTSSGQGAALIPLSGLPTADNHFYVRAWINFAKATNTVTGHAAFLVAGSTLDQSGTELRLGVSIPPGYATAMVDLNLQNPMDGAGGEVTRFSNGFTTGADPLNMAGTTFQADTWTCVEALFDGGHNEFRLWIGETEVMNMHVTNFAARPTDTPRVSWAPSFKFLKIGAQDYSGDIGQVWYDDVVVATAFIGCG